MTIQTTRELIAEYMPADWSTAIAHKVTISGSYSKQDFAITGEDSRKSQNSPATGNPRP